MALMIRFVSYETEDSNKGTICAHDNTTYEELQKGTGDLVSDEEISRPCRYPMIMYH